VGLGKNVVVGWPKGCAGEQKGSGNPFFHLLGVGVFGWLGVRSVGLGQRGF
jgi:hypothetical protein